MTRREALSGIAASMLLVPGGGRAAAAQSRVHSIFMHNMRFGAVPAGIRAGDTIVWVNRDVVPHTATARDRSFDIVVAGRQSVRMTVRRAGRVALYCRYHPAMTATLAVGR